MHTIIILKVKILQSEFVSWLYVMVKYTNTIRDRPCYVVEMQW